MLLGFDGCGACDGMLTEISGLERRCGACDGCGVDGVLVIVLLGFNGDVDLIVRERRGRKERGNGRNREKERRRKKRKYWKKKRIGKIILKKEYKNIIYIKYII